MFSVFLIIIIIYFGANSGIFTLIIFYNVIYTSEYQLIYDIDERLFNNINIRLFNNINQ